MCGRYEIHTSPAALALALGLRHPPDIRARYNIAPGFSACADATRHL
jgi:putative SOS response-associated peptidase YedK